MKFAAILFLALLSSCSYRVEKEASLAQLSSDSLGFPEVQAGILGPKCARCHGFVGNYEGVIANLAEISARIQSTDPNFMMPPPNAAPLTASEKSNLQAWIAKGAPRVGGGEGGQPSVPPPGLPPGVPTPPVPPVVPPGPIQPVLSYANVRDSVLVPKCARCHNVMMNDYSKVVENLSEISSRVRSTFDFDQMPPARATQLTAEEKDLLLDWIGAGAPLEAESPGDGSPPPAPRPPAPPPGCDDDDDDDDDLQPESRRGDDDDCRIS